MSDQPRDEAFHFAGDRLGKFVILGELGRGSMGVVYEAFQEDLKRKVALKVLPANISLDIKQVRRFHREAESVARLRHDHVIQIYEVGQIDNTHYFAMELVDGASFGSTSFIRDRAYIDNSARIIRDAARGLAHAHERGVIHRDIKPSNLLVDKNTRVVVTDFGLARLSESTSLTSTDAIVGTPKYMAPEQILPGTYPLDGRCDIYGLGATLYEAVCGNPPIEGPSVQAFLKAILEERPIWPRKRNRLVPHDLSTIVMRCLEKHPGERYADANALADDLDRFLAGERIHAKPKGLAARGVGFVARHKVVSALSVLVFFGLVVALFLTMQVKTKEEIARLLASTDAGLPAAIAEADDLRGKHPRDREVRALLATLRRRHAYVLLASSREEIGELFPVIVDLLKRSEARPGLWRAMLLFEFEPKKEGAEVPADLLREGKLTAPVAALVRANLALLDGDYEGALKALAVEPAEDAPDAEVIYYHFFKGSAHRALKDYKAASASLEAARAATKDIAQPWLAWRVDRDFFDLEDILGGAARLDAVLSIFRVAADRTAALLSNLGRLSEDMSAEERRVAESFIARVLLLAGVETGISSDLIHAGKLRVEEAQASGDANALALGHLVHAIGLLSSGDTLGARDQLNLADDLVVPTLRPYIQWAFSLSFRVERKMDSALRYTLFALEFADGIKFEKADVDLLWTHLKSVYTLATPEQRKPFDARLFKLLQSSNVAGSTSWIPRTPDGGGADGG